MYGKQAVPRKSLERGGNVARRLNAQRCLAPSVINATMVLDEDKAAQGSVQQWVAEQDFQRGVLIIREGEAYFLVQSKFFDRFYVVAKRHGRLWCSASDARVAAWCIEQVEQVQHLAA
jgi:hypothetical protein